MGWFRRAAAAVLKLTEWGVRPGMPGPLALRVRLTNQIALALAVAAFPYGAVYAFDSPESRWFLGLVAAGNSLTLAWLALNRAGRHRIARSGLILSSILMVVVLAPSAMPTYAAHCFLLAIVGLPLILFLPEEKRYTQVSLVATFLASLYLEFGPKLLPPAGRAPGILELVAHTAPITCSLVAIGIHVLLRNAYAFSVRHAEEAVKELEQEIAQRKRREEKIDILHRQLLDASRQAGMAEVAAGVLHNVGNVLNSLNISGGVVTAKIRGLRISNLKSAVELLRSNPEPAKLAQLAVYLEKVAQHLEEEQAAMLKESLEVNRNVEHIKNIINMQQATAKASGITEMVEVTRVIEDALHLSGVNSPIYGIEVVRELDPMRPMLLQRHKILQILLNLLSNARHALRSSELEPKRVIVRCKSVAGNRMAIDVIDNGVGIPADNLTKIFSYGFTTKPNGHGFGLHSSALTAQEMGGTLTCKSEGPGKGAHFRLEVPYEEVGVLDPSSDEAA